MNIEAYLNNLKGKKIAVLGVGVSNRPLVRLLRETGIDITAFDRKTEAELGDYALELSALGVELVSQGGLMDDRDYDVIFRSPAIRPDREDIQKHISRGAILTSEMEAFFEICPCKIVAVTGSDGKTTTTTMVSELLKAAGYSVHLGGNIGRPLLPDVYMMEKGHIAVLELSSFQLMTMKKSPDVAVITNLSPNHLDIHKSMDEYIGAKENIYLHQSPGSITVLNLSNDITRSFEKKVKGSVRFFSSAEKADVCMEEDAIVSYLSGKREIISPASDILLRGVHNYEDYMAAIAAVYDFVMVENIKQVMKNFPGVEHRSEYIRTLDGVEYYNDSIATSPTRVIAGLKTFEDGSAVVILGGYDKNLDFAPMVPYLLSKAHCLVLCGATAGKIRKSVERHPKFASSGIKIIETEDFAEAVNMARDNARPGDVVTLSPACAAFDKFENFAKRGERFKQLVQELK